MSAVPKWTLKGDWFDVCNCNIPCPCEFAQAPTDDHCEGVLAWHVRSGEFGGVRLDDLNVVAVACFDGNVWEGAQTMRVGMYIDERADERQREALQIVFSGRAGGFMESFSHLICEMRGVEYVPIQFEIADDLAYWRASIPGKVEAAAEALTGPTTPPGARVQLLNPPGSEVGPGQIATWGRTTVNTTTGAHGFTWNWAGKSSKHIPFDWQGP
ncbi:MAG: DUF1326 domain-containing protein [Gammaproteobacteria bacterium]|nr:DUF1326 domain-containing protein [Gammaproteobacteria bacterium]